jgi:hypothetical protein
MKNEKLKKKTPMHVTLHSTSSFHAFSSPPALLTPSLVPFPPHSVYVVHDVRPPLTFTYFSSPMILILACHDSHLFLFCCHKKQNSRCAFIFDVTGRASRLPVVKYDLLFMIPRGGPRPEEILKNFRADVLLPLPVQTLFSKYVFSDICSRKAYVLKYESTFTSQNTCFLISDFLSPLCRVCACVCAYMYTYIYTYICIHVLGAPPR